MTCEHRNFENKTEVSLTAEGRLLCTVMIRCRDCKAPFEFQSREGLLESISAFVVPRGTPEERPSEGGSSRLSWKSE
jgi:hypothetical protein